MTNSHIKHGFGVKMSQFQKIGHVVLVDDDKEMREMLRDFLLELKYQVSEFDRAAQAFTAFQENTLPGGGVSTVDAVVTDLKMPEMDGLEFTQRLGRFAPDIPVILITAFGTIESAIEATKHGAQTYIVKPLKLNEFEVSLRKAIELRRLRSENSLLKKEIKRNWSRGEIIGKSRAMNEVFDLITRVSKASANVFISGESGTGKEMIARAIHENGPRAGRPFVAINCTAIPYNLLESELFGHVKGSFTGAIGDKKGLFEEAQGGTLFLDEIGDLDMALQAKLLRVLQERKIKPVGTTKYKEIDVRIISATHKDLKKSIQEEGFREDLFYRLSVIPIEVPSLRERKEDIPVLADYFLKKYTSLNNSKVEGFSSEALQVLMSARWEGNVRELENLIERIVVLTKNETIQVEDIPFLKENNVESFYNQASADWPTIDQLVNRYIEKVLKKVGGKKEKAAQILGINRRTLYRKELSANNENYQQH